jgi:hypothetical protein
VPMAARPRCRAFQLEHGGHANADTERLIEGGDGHRLQTGFIISPILPAEPALEPVPCLEEVNDGQIATRRIPYAAP